jgi:hypothetical protein
MAVKLRYETHYVTLQLHPEVLEETKVDPVRAWAFKAVTIPDCLLNLCLQKRSRQTSALNLIQLFEAKIIHPRSIDASGLKMGLEIRKHSLPDGVHPLNGDPIHLNR